MTEQITDAAFQVWAQKVAAELGLAYVKRNYWAHLVAPDGTGYSLERPYNGKIEIVPLYPPTSFSFYRQERGKIGVSFGRDPAAVKRDIERRLAPQYAETLAAVREHNTSQAAQKAAREALAAQIAGLYPAGVVTLPEHAQSDFQTKVYVSGQEGYGGGWLRISGDGTSVETDGIFRFSAGAAKAALAAAAEYEAAHTEEKS